MERRMESEDEGQNMGRDSNSNIKSLFKSNIKNYCCRNFPKYKNTGKKFKTSV